MVGRMVLWATFSGRIRDDFGQSEWNVCGAGPRAVAVVEGPRAVDKRRVISVKGLGFRG